MPVSSPGIGSSLDVNSIVTQLTALERKPLDSLQVKAAGIQSKLSTYGQIKSQLSALGDAASKLRLDSTWNALAVKSSNEAAVSATVSGVASAASYSIEVQQLAKAQSAASAVVPKDSTVGSGSLTIELGTWDPGYAAFTVAPGGPAAIVVSLSVDSTLREVMDKINAANAGVEAIVVQDGLGGERLSVKSSTTGEAQLRQRRPVAIGLRPAKSARCRPDGHSTGTERPVQAQWPGHRIGQQCRQGHHRRCDLATQSGDDDRRRSQAFT